MQIEKENTMEMPSNAVLKAASEAVKLADWQGIASAYEQRLVVILHKVANLKFCNKVADSRQETLIHLIEQTTEYLRGDVLAADVESSLIKGWQQLNEDVLGMERDIHAHMSMDSQVQDLKFPFPEAREGQREAAADIHKMLLKGDATVCAPTGFGKSPVLVTAVSGYKGGAYIITPQRILVEQYKKDFEGKVEWMGFLKSRADFKCKCSSIKAVKGEDGPTCDDKAETCTSKAICPYKLARDEALRKPVVVMTAAMAATLMLYQAESFPKRAVLAVDECQRLEDTLMSACTSDVLWSTLTKDGWTMENDSDDPDNPLMWPLGKTQTQQEVRTWLWTWAMRAQRRLNSMDPKSLSLSETKIFRRYTQLCSKIKLAAKFDSKEGMGGSRRPHAWVYDDGNERYKQPTKMTVKPLAATGMLDDIMGEASQRKLLISATPGDPVYMQNTLGLKSTPAYGSYGTPFPVSNRNLIYMPTVRLTYTSGADDYKKLINAIVMIAGTVGKGRRNHSEQKGIIHTVSNKLHAIIIKGLQDAGMGSRIREVKGSYKRLETIASFKKSSLPLILVGPAITDGISLDGDECRWGIIAKLPWPPTPALEVKYRKENIKDWYVMQVVMSVIQACGRNVRSKDDWATNYMLDAGFSSLLERNEHLFPGWFLDAIYEI